MTDPLDLDARMDELTELVYATRARGDALGLGSLAIGDLLDVIESDRAELRTARAERDAQARDNVGVVESYDVLAARIDHALALCDAADAQVHDHFGGDGSMVNTAQIRAALSGAIEPAEES